MFCILVHGYCLVLLGTIGYLGTSLAIVNKVATETAEMCDIHPLKAYTPICNARGVTGMALLFCQMETSGEMMYNGKMDRARCHELYEPYISPSRQGIIDDTLAVIDDCLVKGGPINTVGNAEIALQKCDTFMPAVNLLIAAICATSETA